MDGALKLKVGEKFVEYGEVYKIFKIKKQASAGGTREDYLFYKPCYQTRTNQTLTCSVPKSEAANTNIRGLSSKETIQDTLKYLAKSVLEKITSPIDAVGVLKLNDPHETAKLLKQLWLLNHATESNFSTSNQLYFKDAFRNLTQEVSAVLGIQLAEAERKILAQLTKLAKPRLANA